MALLTGSRPNRLATTISLLLLAVRGAAAQAPRSEYEVKAAYLLNFARYAEWPTAAAADSGADLVICVLGHDPFGAVLDRTVAGRRVLGHPVRVMRPGSRAEAELCRLLNGVDVHGLALDAALGQAAGAEYVRFGTADAEVA